MRGFKLSINGYFSQTQLSVLGQFGTGLLQMQPGLSGQIVDLLLLVFAITIALVATNKVAAIKIIFFIVMRFKVKTVLINYLVLIIKFPFQEAANSLC